MERVETLLHKLQQQFTDKATASELLLTVQMLQNELMFLKGEEPAIVGQQAAIVMSMPFQGLNKSPEAAVLPSKASEVEEAKTVEVLQVDEAEIEAELEEIKRNAATMQQISVQSKPQLLFSLSEDDIPTLPQQIVTPAKEINDLVGKEIVSVNDVLNENKTELSDKLHEASSIKDLKKAIGINDRFLYINELFRGDEVMYERSIKTINGFAIWPEAEYWIRRELKTKLGWKDAEPTVMQFDQLVKRRFA
jgi:hypothetical protein